MQMTFLQLALIALAMVEVCPGELKEMRRRRGERRYEGQKVFGRESRRAETAAISETRRLHGEWWLCGECGGSFVACSIGLVFF